MNTWLVMVNATKYNLFGAVRKYGDAIPWFFDGTTGATVGDEVLFYLTPSNPSDNDEGYGKALLGSLYKRVAFRGVITKVGVDKNSEEAQRDDEFWSTKQSDDYMKKHNEIVLIKIEQALYDKKYDSSFFDKDMWKATTKTFVVKVPEEIAKKIN